MCAQIQAAFLDVPFPPVENGRYLMITRIEIKNFRCFDSQALTGLKRFNLIVGESGSGKTALLETLFLISSGGPESFFRLRKWRGFGDSGKVSLNGTKDSYEGLFRYIFHDQGEPASIQSTDARFGRRSLNIFFEEKKTLNVSFEAPEHSVMIKPIHFRYDVGNKHTEVVLEIKDGALHATGGTDIYPMHYISSKNISSAFDAQLFSQISREARADELVRTIKEVYPEVEGLSLEIDGGETLIHAKMKGLKFKIPVNELSGGLNKFLSIAVAIASNREGVVCVDEIENGFYFKNNSQVISGLIALCNHYQVQLFASTHSWEFLQAFAPALKGIEDDFCLIKSSYENGTSSMRVIGGGQTISAINQDIEIRN
jgi:energy-coupling factor transporter ATP-binding protein EcfA2